VATAYDSAGVDRFAIWVHETDEAMREELAGRGYGIDETTLAMGMSLDRVPAAQGDVEVGALAWTQYLEFLWSSGDPRVLADADPEAFHALGVRLKARTVSAAIAFDHQGDCGIYNMGTLEPFRRRGFGTALLAAQLRDAADRGCSTASLQSTPMAEGVYAAGGFESLGRFLEFGPMS
jgi:GNAT superfamily N-acetyltransferase